MTPREVLVELFRQGYCLSLRPGGLRLACDGEAPPEVLGLIREHRAGLIALLEDDARRCSAMEGSIAAGRITPFPPHLLELVHPSIRHLVAPEPPRKVRRVGHLPLMKGLQP